MKYFGFSISKVQTESDSIAFHLLRGILVVGLRKNKHIRCKKCYAHYNGSEFMGEFDKYLKEIGIEHYYSYPRTPKTNSNVERVIRTIEEELWYRRYRLHNRSS